jgi:hypothetical protein
LWVWARAAYLDVGLRCLPRSDATPDKAGEEAVRRHSWAGGKQQEKPVEEADPGWRHYAGSIDRFQAEKLLA